MSAFWFRSSFKPFYCNWMLQLFVVFIWNLFFDVFVCYYSRSVWIWCCSRGKVYVCQEHFGILWFRNVVVILSLLSLQLSGNKKTYLSTSVHSAVVWGHIITDKLNKYLRTQFLSLRSQQSEFNKVWCDKMKWFNGRDENDS